MKYSVCFVTAELAPHAKAGGLADVSAALTRILHLRGHPVVTVLPLHGALDREGLALENAAGLADLSMQLGLHSFRYSLLRGRRAPGLPELMLVDCPALYDRPALYGSGLDEHLRFLLLTRAAFEACRRLGFAPDILHCNDWHTALAPLYLRASRDGDPLFARTRSVLSIHNLGYQGVFPATVADDLGPAAALVDPDEAAAGRINFLREGIVHADAVSTVSPTYASEICTPELGMGLDGVLRARGDAVVGILNGVDTGSWDPSRDTYLPFRYSASDLEGKSAMRQALCERVGIAPDAARPLVGMVTRLAWQKGIDLLFDVLPRALARREFSMVVLGSGDPGYEEYFSRLQSDEPGRFAYVRGYDEELAHWIEAGCDAFLMPSRYEPCGLNQMYSLRYGTVPIVRRTGGLADSVQHFDPGSGEGTGVVFNDADAGGVRWALEYARMLFRDPRTWRRMVANGMAQDFSWETAVDGYLDLYARAVARPR